MTGMASRVRAIVRYSGSVRLRAASAGMAVSKTAEPGMARSARKALSGVDMRLMVHSSFFFWAARVSSA
eukprot:12504304-Alexandrium_andersonii.AAC.1